MAGFAGLSLGVDAGEGLVVVVVLVEFSLLVSVVLGGVTDAVALRLSFL
ncbi:MAG TPA: hypothetical protein VIJ34_10180 [Acidimicrobiales bacterium]